jgi:hypothetical protein
VRYLSTLTVILLSFLTGTAQTIVPDAPPPKTHIFSVPANMAVEVVSDRNAKFEQRFTLERSHTQRQPWERVGEPYYYNNTRSLFKPIREWSLWKIRIESDGSTGEWRESRIIEIRDGGGQITYVSDDVNLKTGRGDGDYDDLVVKINLRLPQKP